MVILNVLSSVSRRDLIFIVFILDSRLGTGSVDGPSVLMEGVDDNTDI